MTKETIKAQAKELVERGKELAEEGNQRHMVFHRDNTELFQVNVTVAVAVALVLLITGFLSIPLVVIASFIAYVWGVRVELYQNEQLETTA